MREEGYDHHTFGERPYSYIDLDRCVTVLAHRQACLGLAKPLISAHIIRTEILARGSYPPAAEVSGSLPEQVLLLLLLITHKTSCSHSPCFFLQAKPKIHFPRNLVSFEIGNAFLVGADQAFTLINHNFPESRCINTVWLILRHGLNFSTKHCAVDDTEFRERKQEPRPPSSKHSLKSSCAIG